MSRVAVSGVTVSWEPRRGGSAMAIVRGEVTTIAGARLNVTWIEAEKRGVTAGGFAR